MGVNNQDQKDQPYRLEVWDEQYCLQVYGFDTEAAARRSAEAIERHSKGGLETRLFSTARRVH